MKFSKKLKEMKQEVLRDSAEAFQSLDEISEANTLKGIGAAWPPTKAAATAE
mgnify:CR=1 FL=1